MPNVLVRVTQNGQPLVGAEVLAGEIGSDITDENGKVSIVAVGKPTPMAIEFLVLGDGIQYGGGPFRVAPGELFELEI